MSSARQNYQTKSPVLFIIFNRPNTTARVFEKIREAQPSRLYIAADGPRTNREGEAALCAQTREVAAKVDWDCDVKTLFKEKNVGCKEAEASAMTWFFDNEEEGIILEDDCLPANSFFRFCDVLLEKYRFDTRIRHITGNNFQRGKKWGNASYYFSKNTHGWGWAGWRRVWKDYDKDLKQYDEKDIKEKLTNVFDDSLVIESWYNIFKGLKAGEINTWDYQYGLINFFNNGLCITPNVNMVSNIGFGADATHTTESDHIFANIPVVEIDEITHPIYFLAEKQADAYTLNDQFNIAERRRKQNLLRRRFKRWLRSFIGNK